MQQIKTEVVKIRIPACWTDYDIFLVTAYILTRECTLHSTCGWVSKEVAFLSYYCNYNFTRKYA